MYDLASTPHTNEGEYMREGLRAGEVVGEGRVEVDGICGKQAGAKYA